MKNLILLMVCAITIPAYHANAQYWTSSDTNIYNNNSGNVQITRDLEMIGKNNGTSTLGAIRWGGEVIASKRTAGGNQNGLDFYTNSTNRMSITNAGNIKIARDLEMIGNNNGTSTLGAIRWGGEVIASKRTAGGNQNGLDFYTNSQNRMSITNAGKVGIGTTTPTSLLSVVKAAAGATVDFRNTSMGPNISWVHFGSTGDWYIRSAANNGKVILQDQSTGGKVGIGTTNPFRKFEVQNGDIRISTGSDISSYLEFLRAGSTPPRIDFRFEHESNDFSSRLFVSSSNDDFASACDVAWFQPCGSASVFVINGSAVAFGGIWEDSDQKLKRNITDFNSAMEIVKQLKPKTYHFRTEDYAKLNLPGTKQYGFIAQDIEKLLPELVQTTQQPVKVNANGERQMEDIKSVRYVALIPILTKAMQEQQEQIITLVARITKLEAALSNANVTSGGEDNAVSTGLSDASLAQNIPNPFTNTTTINYTLPEKFTNAQILITDNNGKTLRRINLSGTGKGAVQINASAFSSGTCQYSLYVNGRLIASKRMILAK